MPNFLGFLKAIPKLLIRKVEETTLFAGLPKVRIPITIKAAAAGVALAPAAALRTLLPVTIKKVAIGATVTGILAVSPKARKFIITKIADPTKVGREIGAIIEDPSKLQPDVEKGETTIEKIKEVAKAAGVVGGAAAVAAAVAAAIKKARERGEPIPGIPPIGAQAAPDVIFEVPEPIGVVEKPVEKPVEPVPVAVPAAMPDIINKIVFRPEINVRVSQTRKFINQQILIPA